MFQYTKLLTHLKNLTPTMRASGTNRDAMQYISMVWIPEAILMGMEKFCKISYEEATGWFNRVSSFYKEITFHKGEH